MFKVILSILLLVSVYEGVSQNQNVSQSAVFDGEPYMAVDPSNSSHIVVAWMGWKLNQGIVIKTKYSLNGGVTWSVENALPHLFSGNTSADPSIAFNSLGDVFVCYIDYDNNVMASSNGAVYTVKSVDGGATWMAPVESISIADCPNEYCIDRPWMVIDNSGGVNDGTIYIAAMNADRNVSAPYNPYLSVSSDGGVSYVNPRFLDSVNFLSGSLIPQPMPSPAVSANGDFIAVYPSFMASQSPLAHYYMAKSSDKGGSLQHTTALSLASGFPTDAYAKNGHLLISDPSDDNHYVVLYISIANGDQDVMLVETNDGGLNWSAAVRVNKDAIGNGVMQDLVWADFDTDGDLVVSWRDRRNGVGTGFEVDSEIYASVKWKDSLTFSSDFPVSDVLAAYDTILEGKANDFMNVQLQNDTLMAVWGDVRNGKMTIWFNRMDLVSGVSFVSEVTSNKFIKLYPNPASSIITFTEIELGNSVRIQDINGRLIFDKEVSSSSFDVNVSDWSEGIYMVQIIDGDLVRTGRFVIER
jgi:hypothetical protein